MNILPPIKLLATALNLGFLDTNQKTTFMTNFYSCASWIRATERARFAIAAIP